MPTVRGVKLCLHKLSEEAGDLGLTATQAAIRHALDVCARESAAALSGLTHLN